MIRENNRATDRHSDLGPSSKDWQTGSPGRDESFTPDKDRWTQARKGDLGSGRPGEDIHSGSAYGSGRETGEDIQPGTHRPGRSWTSDHPDRSSTNEALDDAVEDSFPASDPPSMARESTGWVLGRNDEQDSGRRGGWSTMERVRTAIPASPWRSAALFLVPAVLSAAWVLRRSQRSRQRRGGSSGDRRF